MSMWIQDLKQVDTNELEDLCDELELKIDEGREELTRREEMHPTCRMCGEYIFAVDGCKGHGDD